MTSFLDLAIFHEMWSRAQAYCSQQVLSWAMAAQER
jgi:hypothetical protein